MSLPQIETILTSPSYHARNNQLFPIISVGLQLDNGQVFWGDCRVTDGSGTHQDTQNIIEQSLAPRLRGQPVADFHDLCRLVDETMESYQYEEIIPQEGRPHQVADQSRRKLWQQLSQTVVAEPTRIVQAERPLPTALRYGISQAILQACAAHTQQPLTRFLTPADTTTQPELIVQAEDVSHAPLFPHVGGIRYTIQTKEPAKHLGQQGEKLQGYLRQLAQWLSRMATAGNHNHQPILYLEARGITGELYQNNLGRLLGMVYGLDLAVKPYKLYIVDPLSPAELEAEGNLLKETKSLINYLGFRKLEAQVGVSRPIQRLSDVQMWAEEKGADFICLRPHQLGTLSQLYQAADICHQAEIPFTVICHPRETNRTIQLLTAAGQATQASFLHLPSSTNLFLEVNRWQHEHRITAGINRLLQVH